jgi:HAD superfamily hydrolase (TIGR01549 family)
MIKVIIFDWDGVIVDSMPWIYKAMQEVLSSYGIEKSIEEVSSGFFQPRDEYYNSFGVNIIDKEELDRRHKEAIKKYKIPDFLFPEVREVLHFLKKNNFQLGIGSSTSNLEINRQLDFLNLKDIFSEELILGGEENKKEKLQNFLKILNSPLNEILYIGDLASDITAAQAVGVKSAGIERRKEALEKLGKLKPDYLFSSLSDLKLLLEKQLNKN